LWRNILRGVCENEVGKIEKREKLIFSLGKELKGQGEDREDGQVRVIRNFEDKTVG
jgi:hypothetical protein